ncbi:MAG: FAD-dependent monooxygenase [Myxococcota bacterium]
MRILVVGAGIAGLTVAQLLAEQGHSVEIFERAPGPRDEGYMIDFFGPGYDVAERLDLLSELAGIHYPVPHLLFMDDRGRTHCDMEYATVRDRLFGGRHFNFMRGDLERVLRDRLDGLAPIRFATEPVSFSLGVEDVLVSTSTGHETRYDWVIGADGVRSRVREHLFAERSHLVPLRAHTAAFVLDGTLPELDARYFTSVVASGRTAAAYPIRGGKTATFFVHEAADPIEDRSRRACFAELEREYSGCGTLTDTMLEHLDEAHDVYFDELLQVEVASWSCGRAVLLGDACGCVSLLGGQGASMAMAGASVLADAVAREPNLEAAFARYEQVVRPEVTARQKIGRRSRSWFLPPSRRRARWQLKITHHVLRSPLASVFGRSIGGASLEREVASSEAA